MRHFEATRGPGHDPANMGAVGSQLMKQGGPKTVSPPPTNCQWVGNMVTCR